MIDHCLESTCLTYFWPWRELIWTARMVNVAAKYRDLQSAEGWFRAAQDASGVVCSWRFGLVRVALRPVAWRDHLKSYLATVREVGCCEGQCLNLMMVLQTALTSLEVF